MEHILIMIDSCLITHKDLQKRIKKIITLEVSIKTSALFIACVREIKLQITSPNRLAIT